MHQALKKIFENLGHVTTWPYIMYAKGQSCKLEFEKTTTDITIKFSARLDYRPGFASSFEKNIGAPWSRDHVIVDNVREGAKLQIVISENYTIYYHGIFRAGTL